MNKFADVIACATINPERVAQRLSATGNYYWDSPQGSVTDYHNVVTPEHVLNLAELAAHLARLPDEYEHFDMSLFHSATCEEGRKTVPEQDVRALQECGTVACAIGHAPAATGILRQRGEDWATYSRRVTGLQSSTSQWRWCFGGFWGESSDWDHRTPRAAAGRIAYLLSVEGGNVENRDERELDPDERGFIDYSAYVPD